MKSEVLVLIKLFISQPMPDAICMARNPFYVDRQSYPSQPLRPNYEADQYVKKRRERTVLKKKGPPGERDKQSAATRYIIKDWISF